MNPQNPRVRNEFSCFLSYAGFTDPTYFFSKLVEMAEKDPVQIELWTTSIWSQVVVYALADKSWHKSFRPKGVSEVEWRATICDFICNKVFAELHYE